MNTHVLSPQSSASEYLDVASLTGNIFLIGLLDKGVTIFNQQVRALNLIWALDRVGRLDPAVRIAVVGGGIAGLTAAMALRTISAHSADPSSRAVTLFEQRSVLCPLQRGCATRWVHPHIYDWPEEGSTNPSAGLPIMNWRAGRASDVAATVVSEWDQPPYKAVEIEQWLNLRYLKIDHKNNEIEWVGEQHIDGATLSHIRGDKRAFDIIILAIGFGSERRSSKHGADSYWRNETLGQPDLTGRQQRYLISGTGDGGLIDLLRLRIADFREDRIGHQLAPESSDRYKAIQRLRVECFNTQTTEDAELFDRCRKLGCELKLVDDIKRRLRADTLASLQIHGGKRVSDAFCGKSSFVNRFLVSLLFDAGGFSPRFGDLEKEETDGFDKIVVRHGTDTQDHLKSIFSGDISSPLDELQTKRCTQNSIVEKSEKAGLWGPGWPFDRKTGVGPGSLKRDYVPAATVAVSSAFVSALAPVFSARGGEYRATLHRIVTMHTGEVHLQQIAYYYGPRAVTKASLDVTGRLFKIDDAVIGLAAKCGRVLTTRNSDEPIGDCQRLLREDMQLLNGNDWDPERMDPDVCSLFACPLVCNGENTSDTATKVVAVLFADSTSVGAFDESTVAQIVSACQEFGKYLQRIAQSKPYELISVKSQATYNVADDSAGGDFSRFSMLTASPTAPPLIPVEYINLDWWT